MSTPAPASPISAREVRLEFTFHVPPAKVWQALVKDTTAWWPQSFYTSAKTKRFILEPKLGGMMGEVSGAGEGLVWYRVIGVEKNASLLLAGYLLPPWAGPATSLLRLTLTAESGGTKLELVDSTFGVVGDGSATADGWRQIFADHFKPHVEKARSRKR